MIEARRGSREIDGEARRVLQPHDSIAAVSRYIKHHPRALGRQPDPQIEYFRAPALGSASGIVRRQAHERQQRCDGVQNCFHPGSPWLQPSGRLAHSGQGSSAEIPVCQTCAELVVGEFEPRNSAALVILHQQLIRTPVGVQILAVAAQGHRLQ